MVKSHIQALREAFSHLSPEYLDVLSWDLSQLLITRSSDPHVTDDIFKVMRSKLKVTEDNIFQNCTYSVDISK